MRFWVFLAAACAALAGPWGEAAAAPPLEAYGHLPAIDHARLSPKGDRLALVEVSGEARKLDVYALPDKTLLSAPIGNAKVWDLQWAGEDNLLVTFSATVDMTFNYDFKNELQSVLRLDLTTGKGFVVFNDDPALLKHVVGRYGIASTGGDWVGFFGGVTMVRDIAHDHYMDHGWPDLYRVDLATGHHQLVAHGAASSRGWATTADGQVVAYGEFDTQTGRWRLRSGGFLGKVILERQSPLGDIGLEGLGRTPGSVLITDNTGDRSTAEEVSLKDGATTELLHDDHVDELLTDPITHLLIGAVVDAEPGARFFDPRLQARYDAARKAFAKLRVHLESYTPDLGRMILETEGPGDSGTYWLVEIATGHADPIGQLYPGVKAQDVGPVSLVDYKAGDGLQMDGVLTLPPGKAPRNLPLVVMPHGGPIGIYDKPGFDPWAQAFASRGYAVFQPNYRGSGDSTVAFRQAGFGEWGGKMLSDISDGVASLAAKGIIDPKRACIVGASYGGYAALAGVTLQHGLYRCAVSVSGPANMASFFAWQETKHERSETTSATRYWRAATGADKKGDAYLKAISPTSYADKVDVPVLLIHGKDDTVVPIEQSREMEAALKHVGKDVEFIQIPGGDHWELHEDARMATVVNSVAFVLKHNPPD